MAPKPKDQPSQHELAQKFMEDGRVQLERGTLQKPRFVVWHPDIRRWIRGEPALQAEVFRFANKRGKFSTRYLTGVVTQVKAISVDRSKSTGGVPFDSRTDLLGTPDGHVVDLSTGNEAAARMTDYVTMTTAVRPVEAPTPHFDQFMKQFTCDDDELESFLWRLIGCTLAGGREEIAVLLKGEGANGKGTLLGVLQDVLGGYTTLLQHDFFTKEGASRHMTYVAELDRKRLWANPESADGRWVVQRFKTLTGENTITANRMYEDPRPVALDGTLWIAVNKTPTLDGGRAMERRLRVIPCDLKLSSDEIDPAIKNELLPGELPAILGRAIQSAKQYLQDGLGEPPERVRAESLEFLVHSAQPLDAWLDECTEPVPGHHETADALFKSAVRWFEDGGHSWKPTKTGVGRFLGDNGYRSSRTRHGRYWIGLRVKP